jgi:hypothetical protein
MCFRLVPFCICLFSSKLWKVSFKQATENDQSAKKPQKVNSILCQDCEGNGEHAFVWIYRNDFFPFQLNVSAKCKDTVCSTSRPFGSLLE